MTTNGSGTINIGNAVRGGLRLKCLDVVALLHDACLQLDIDGAKKLPTSIDELSINDTGSVVMQSGRPSPTLRIAVAALLDALLSAVSDEADSVPPALRSLPARLREAGNAAKASDIKDLLTILRWHIPHDPRQVLRELAIRAQLSGLPETPAVIDVFEEETEPIPAAVPVTQARRSWSFSHAYGYAAAALVLLAFAIAGYRYSRITPAPVAEARPNAVETQQVQQPDTATPPAAMPRIVVRDSQTAVHESPAVPVIANPQMQSQLQSQPQPLLLSVNGGAFSPSFSADRRTLIFHAGYNTAGRLFSATLDENQRPSSITPLLEDSGRTYHAKLSPDGQWVAFDSDRDGERAVYVSDRATSRTERVSGTGYAAVPSWSPDMKTIAFVRAEPNKPRVWNLWQRDMATGTLSRLTNLRSGQVWGASWFGDSARFAYSHDDRLIIADRQGRERASFASPIRGRLMRTPAVSPDGTRIVFQVFHDGVWIVDVATGKMRRVLDDQSAEEFAWDPDGRHVAYHSRRDGQWRIWVMPL